MTEKRHSGRAAKRPQRRRMATDQALERFRMLNGLGPRDQVKVGDRIKIVVE